ncbi:MAG: hypothetical protein E7106_01745 [Prevotella sp.]|nr:hypothetical protein [Prevotella sp.]
MKQKLEGHKMAPPAGLWEGISSEMGLQENPVSKTVTIKRWYWIVAALVLALVGFFVLYQFPQDESFPQVAQMPQEQEVPMTKTESTDNQPLALADSPQRNHTQVSPKIAGDTTSQVAEETSSHQNTEKTSSPQDTEETAAQQVAAETPQQTSVMTHRQQHSEEQHYTAHHPTKQLSAPKSRNQWSVGLNASGGLLASTGKSSMGHSYVYDSEYYDPGVNSTTQPIPSSTTYDVEAKHRMPVTLGLSVHYQLNACLALLTGVNYTYLYSEFSKPLYPNVYREQKLHYLGIPVGLSWLFWKTSGFSFYLSGSAMLQKCLNEKPWQWSVNASAGAEYAITPLVGIYLQPSLGYYFHDGTSFEHYYKEHPLAPSIEFGLRLHLSGK